MNACLTGLDVQEQGASIQQRPSCYATHAEGKKRRENKRGPVCFPKKPTSVVITLFHDSNINQLITSYQAPLPNSVT